MFPQMSLAKGSGHFERFFSVWSYLRFLWSPRVVFDSLLQGLIRSAHFAAHAVLLRNVAVPTWLLFDVFNFAGFIIDFLIKVNFQNKNKKKQFSHCPALQNLIAMFFLECAFELCRGNRQNRHAILWIRRGIFVFLIVAGSAMLAVRLVVDLNVDERHYTYICYARSSILFIAGTGEKKQREVFSPKHLKRDKCLILFFFWNETRSFVSAGYVVSCLYYLRVLHRLRLKDSRHVPPFLTFFV